VTPRAAFAVVFLAGCAVVALAALRLDPPPSNPVVSAAPVSPPSTWPDYSVDGPGFVAPAGSEGELVALGYRLVTATFSIIGPAAPDPAKRFAGNNLSCQNCHLDAGTNRTGLPLVPEGEQRPRRAIEVAEAILAAAK